MHNQYESFQINNTEVVMFNHQECGGMVGETHHTTSAKLINMESNETTDLKYTDLNKIYNSMVGRSQRIDFFYSKRPMSPKGISEELQQSTEDAI